MNRLLEIKGTKYGSNVRAWWVAMVTHSAKRKAEIDMCSENGTVCQYMSVSVVVVYKLHGSDSEKEKC